MTQIKRLVLDVLKPHSPTIVELSRKLSFVRGVLGVNCTLAEVDQETESVKITIEGNDISFDAVEDAIRESGAAIHSIDSVSTGKVLVEEVKTPQDL